MSEGREEGRKEGKEEGKAIGILEERRNIILDTLIDRFNLVSTQILEQIRAMQNPDVLKILLKQALKCTNIQEFEAILQRMM
jgi:predicted transposase YdaD